MLFQMERNMTAEILMHINEALSEHQKSSLLISLRNHRGGFKSRFRSSCPNLLFIAYDPRRTRPHELIKITSRAGYHARLIEF